MAHDEGAATPSASDQGAPSDQPPKAVSAWQATAGILAAVCAVSTAAIAIRLAAPLPAAWIAGGRLSITALVLVPFCWRDLRAIFKLLCKDKTLVLKVLASALCLALHFASWITSLEQATVVTSVALVATQPLFAAGLGRVLGDRVPWPAYIGALVAIAGGALMSGSQTGSLLGAALALAGALFAAIYLAIGRSIRARVSLLAYFVLVHAVAATMLLGWAMLTSEVPPGVWEGVWPYVLYLGLVPGVVGHGLLNWAVRHVELHFVSLLVLLEPIGAGALAWWWLDELATVGEMVGGLVMLVGVGIGAVGSQLVGRGE